MFISNCDLLKMALIYGYAESYENLFENENNEAPVDFEEGSTTDQCCYTSSLESKRFRIQWERNLLYYTLFFSTISNGLVVLAALKASNKEVVIPVLSIVSSVLAIGCLFVGTRLYCDARELQNLVNNLNYFDSSNTSSSKESSGNSER